MSTTAQPSTTVADPRLDPHDYESDWYKPLRTIGIEPWVLAYARVQMVSRLDTRLPDAVMGERRFYYRYAVFDGEDAQPCTHRLFALDLEHPRAQWEGPARPELLYFGETIIPQQRLVVCGDVLGCWVLASVGLPSATFLCGPRVGPPGYAIGHIVKARPSEVLVVDNQAGTLPGGALGVVRALRSLGVRAGAVQLPAYPVAQFWGGSTVVDLVQHATAQQSPQAPREAVMEALAALGQGGAAR
jgi:hypothetical protein